MYTGGALMILAPLGLTGCPKDHDDKDLGPADLVADRPDLPDGWVDPEVIAIAPPFDPGSVDGPPEMIAIAPWDPGPPDVTPDIIAIAPFDLGPTDVPPDLIAIAPFDPGTKDAPPDLIAIAPFDPGPDAPPLPPAAGFGAPCLQDTDCSQEFFCEVGMICIVPAPGCGDMVCLPRACGTDDKCPAGSTCMAYDRKMSGSTMKTCVRIGDGIPGDLLQRCASDADCNSPLHFCRDGCPPDVACIVAVDVCLPIPCDPAAPACPEGSACQEAGITTACVKTT